MAHREKTFGLGYNFRARRSYLYSTNSLLIVYETTIGIQASKAQFYQVEFCTNDEQELHVISPSRLLDQQFFQDGTLKLLLSRPQCFVQGTTRYKVSIAIISNAILQPIRSEVKKTFNSSFRKINRCVHHTSQLNQFSVLR